jgi:uncharacterized protein YjbI with pentapeptide repeats
MEAKRKAGWRLWRPPKQRNARWRWTGFTGKTLWDWLQLLSALAIPVVLAVAGYYFSSQQDERQRLSEVRRANSEQAIEEQRAQDAALQAYLDQMSQLMLNGKLRNSEEDSEVRTLARARTRTVLARLDGHRKGSVVQFLYEASLIDKENPVVSLSDVRLRGADLSGADLSEADLSGAILRGAKLSGADLGDADLSGANLIEADLTFAIMSVANMSGTYLDKADLSDVNLIETDLSGAVLSGAVLRRAVLSGADLRETYLNGIDLHGADLSDTNLRDARGVTDEQLEEQAQTLQGATMPGGSIHD